MLQRLLGLASATLVTSLLLVGCEAFGPTHPSNQTVRSRQLEQVNLVCNTYAGSLNEAAIAREKGRLSETTVVLIDTIRQAVSPLCRSQQDLTPDQFNSVVRPLVQQLVTALADAGSKGK